MARRDGRIGLVLGLVVLVAAGCGDAAPAAALPDAPPVVVEEIDGSDISRLTLSEQAAKRLGIETAPVREAQSGGITIPYAGVVYDADGGTWAYTNPDGLVFVRHLITVDRIEGDTALLVDGPPVGTLVVTVAAAELWGVETGVGGGH
jgi:hypothetical protein